MAHTPRSLADTLAYPCSIDYGNGSIETHLGMTMRQHYAGLAMQGLLASWPDEQTIKPDSATELAVQIADALCKSLEKEAP